ncbi:type I DNA topoisomerase, partial [Ruminococcaceae bacterium OttesenSCG-928-N02]|nr:type I DNA topoisomerase [Ruminococcaceae bacterium OttesenSCG-928-N02]
MSKLVIVESPAKAKTIQKYLGADYEVMASMGHIRDLPASQLGIDVKNNYRPQYINIAGKAPLIKKLKGAATQADAVYLATDPDREGEAISWHLAHILGLDTEQENRVTFDEITKKGVTKGMENPRTIDRDLFDAQQARRTLDRLVGYKISPFLWKTIQRGLSGGRVQSVALRLIVDREKAIKAFVPQEYWNIDASLSGGGSAKRFGAQLHGPVGGKKMTITNEQQATEIENNVKGQPFTVKKLNKAKRLRKPAPPFITSTLQQEASRRLGFTAARTMRAAQTLYEGVEISGQGVTGLITYMRTDSLRVSQDAIAEATAYISNVYGERYLVKGGRTFAARAGAQDAHEAIRPTSVSLTPDAVAGSLTGDTAKLYRLIWNRFLASQMADAQLETVNTDILAGDYIFKASGFTMLFDGFTTLYEEATDDDKAKKETALPPLSVGEELKMHKLEKTQKFTQPPPRFTEASLIKEMEENGIGRPSTYAPIISTVIDRGYVEREKKQLIPTELGIVVNDVMVEHFPNIVDVKFSAGMEGQLDD